MALAREHHARIFLRIDDMDRERANPVYVQDIFDTLDFLGIRWDEGPRNRVEFEQSWSQRRRLHLYQDILDRLIQSGALFACRCSRADILRAASDDGYPGTCRDLKIPLDTPGVAWRMDTTDAGHGSFRTTGGQTYSGTLPAEMRHFIVRKKDGLPAYQLASVADDIYYGINIVVRGLDLLPSTLTQVFLAERAGLDGFAKVTFHHHPLLVNTDGEKLSKSDGAASVQYLRKQGLRVDEVWSRVGSLAEIKGVRLSLK